MPYTFTPISVSKFDSGTSSFGDARDFFRVLNQRDFADTAGMDGPFVLDHHTNSG